MFVRLIRLFSRKPGWLAEKFSQAIDIFAKRLDTQETSFVPDHASLVRQEPAGSQACVITAAELLQSRSWRPFTPIFRECIRY